MSPTARRRPLGAIAIVAGLAALTACGDDSSDAGAPSPTNTSPAPSAGDGPRRDDLDGRTFVASDAAGDTGTFPRVDGTVISLRFDGDNLGISAGCNGMGGAYFVDDGVLVVGGLSQTEMACDQPLMDQDASVAALLTDEPRLTLEGDNLTVTAADGTTLILLDRRVADPDRPLEGTMWTVVGVIEGDAVSSGWDSAIATITIANGSASVNTGCNQGSAAITITNDTGTNNTGTDDTNGGLATTGELTVGPLGLTKIGCSGGAAALEAAVVATLQGTVTYTIEAGSLTLVGPGGIGLTLEG